MSGIDDVYKYVDEITYSPGSSYFDVDFTGHRTLNIGSNAFGRTEAGQLLEAAHELVHAQKWHHTLNYRHGGDFMAALDDFIVSKPFGSPGYAFDEVIAESLALRRVARWLELTPQQIAAASRYISGWRAP